MISAWQSFVDANLLGVAAAVLVFAVVAAVALLVPDERKLDRRARDLMGAKSANRRTGTFAQIQLAIRDYVPLTEIRQAILDWLAIHSAMGTQKRLLLLQAGMRQPRSYLFFELGRVASGICAAIGCYVLLDAFGLFAGSPVLGVALLLLILMVGLYVPGLYLNHRIKTRRRAFIEYWDDALGLLIICLDAGLSIEVAMRRIAQQLAATAPVLAEEFIITVTDLSLLKERRLAYLNLSQRMDLPSVKSVTIALIQAEKQGASIANSLRTISAANRQKRITTAEEKAAALGPKMTIPMIVFFLPVVFVVILAPVILSSNG